MSRYRLSLLLLALPLVACDRREIAITPEPPRAPVEVAPTPAPAPQGGPEQNLPPSKNGVLSRGAADRVIAVGQKPIVRLLDAGAQPRADLSYAFAKGATNKMIMHMDMTMGMTVQGQKLPSTAIPRMSMGMDAKTIDRSAAGEFKIDSHLVSVRVVPNGGQQEQMAKALRPQLEAMKGLSMGYWVSPKGHVRDVKIGAPPGMPPAAQQLLNGMSQSFESMVTPLPNERVGVGARWQVLSRTSTGGADLLQSAIYTLKARNGSSATLEVKLVQLAASDTIHSPQMPAGMSAHVKAFNSGGSGTTQVDLKSVAPEAGSMTLRTTMDLAVQGGGPGGGDESRVETTTTVQIARP